MVVESTDVNGAVRFVNSAFWGPSNNVARINGTRGRLRVPKCTSSSSLQYLTPTLPALFTAQATVSFSQCTFSAWDADKQVASQRDVRCEGVIALSLNPVACLCCAPHRTALPSTPLLATFSCKAVTSRWMATRCVSSQ